MTNEPEKMPRGDIATLLAIMARLRDPENGCPWDRQQTFESIAPYTIEEAYEVSEAIANKDMDNLREELGDLLLQVVFHARMAEEAGAFDFAAVVAAITGKMIFRHPHVFGAAHERGQVKEGFWERAKAAERKAKGKSAASGLADVPLALPALTRAEKLQKAAARVGFDWPDAEGVVDKVCEEARELKEAMASGSHDRAEDELGDVLFTLVNLARHLKLDPEKALRRANRKFALRFALVEAMAADRGVRLEDLSGDELDEMWKAAKAARG